LIKKKEKKFDQVFSWLGRRLGFIFYKGLDFAASTTPLSPSLSLLLFCFFCFTLGIFTPSGIFLLLIPFPVRKEAVERERERKKKRKETII